MDLVTDISYDDWATTATTGEAVFPKASIKAARYQQSDRRFFVLSLYLNRSKRKRRTSGGHTPKSFRNCAIATGIVWHNPGRWTTFNKRRQKSKYKWLKCYEALLFAGNSVGNWRNCFDGQYGGRKMSRKIYGISSASLEARSNLTPYHWQPEFIRSTKKQFIEISCKRQ